jgi:polysaccharide biosynthesis transport protein
MSSENGNGDQPVRIQVASPPPTVPDLAGGEVFGGPPTLRLREVLGVLRRNFLLIVVSVAAGGALAYGLVKRERPLYQASALIRLHDLSLDLTQGVGNTRASAVKADPILSELVVLRGRAVAGTVVDTLGMRLFDVADQAPARWATRAHVSLAPEERLTLPLRFTEREVIIGEGSAAVRAPYGVPTGVTGVRFTVPRRPAVDRTELAVIPRDNAIDYVIAGLDARAREGTTAIDVTFSGLQRRMAIDVVNHTVAAYRALSAATERERDRQRVAFLAQQLSEAEWSLRRVQEELSAFRGKHQVRRSTERFATEQQTLTQLEMRRREHDSDQRTYQTLLTQMDGGSGAAAALRALAADSSIGGSPAVSRLFTELTAIESARDSLVASGKLPAHPLVRQINERVSAAEERLRDAVRAQVALLGGRIGELDQMRASSAAEMAKLSVAEAEELRLEQRALSVQQLWEQLREQYQLARMDEAVDAGKVQIIDVATRAVPYSSPKLMKLALGAAAGFFIAIAIAFLRERANTSIRRRIDIERMLRVPSLAVIPQMRRRSRWRSVRRLLPGSNGAARRATSNGNGQPASVADAIWPLIDASVADGVQAEAFRSLRARLMLSHASRERRVLVVTSAEGADGKTTTVANLAVAVAQQGLRVVVVDGDLRRPRVHSLFDVPADPGFVDVLADTVTVDEAVRTSSIGRLYVMPGGIVRSEAPDLLIGDRLTGVFRSLAKRFDLVLVDSPPLNAVPDAAVLAAHADGVILVLRAGRTDRSAASQAVDQLVDVGATIVGAVLNDPDAEAARYPEYARAYGYA